MADTSKISLRLSPALQAALAARVRQHGGRMSDIVREALEAYLGMRPTENPTAQGQMSGIMSDIMSMVETLVADLAALHSRVERIEARETQPPRVRQRQTARPTPSQPAQPEADLPPPRTAGGQRKLTPRQIRALRDKHVRGVPVEALMEEYGLSRASVFRYLRSDKRGGGA